MTEDNKMHLPHVLSGISKKLHSLFFQKLILYDSEILQAKHLRHYDYECEGLFSLINFLERKISKNQFFAFQQLKNHRSFQEETCQIIWQESIRQQLKKAYLKSSESMATPRTKFFTRANTSIEESDNSLIFSPNLKKSSKNGCKTQYFGSSIHVGNQRSDILGKLLNKVKHVNSSAYNDSLQHAKSSYFNLTLGKQSLQTFQDNSQYELQPSSHKKESKQMKRKKILEKFERIEQKIYEQPRTCFSSYVTPRSKIYKTRVKAPNTAYSVYEPLTSDEQQTEVIYVTRTQKKQPQKDYGSSALSSSRSVTNINYARQVYL